MTDEQLSAFRDRVMAAIVAGRMDDVASLAPIEGEPGVIGVELRDGSELFLEIQSA